MPVIVTLSKMNKNTEIKETISRMVKLIFEVKHLPKSSTSLAHPVKRLRNDKPEFKSAIECHRSAVRISLDARAHAIKRRVHANDSESGVLYGQPIAFDF